MLRTYHLKETLSMQESIGAVMIMHPTINPTALALRTKTYEALMPRLIDIIELSGRVRNAHWNIRNDTGFKPLHDLFGSVYEDLNNIIDLLAERLIQFGFMVDGQSSVVASSNKLPMTPLTDTNGQTLCMSMSSLLNVVIKDLLNGLTEFDPVTSNIVEEVIQQLEKHLWMVESHTTPKSDTLMG
jgi:starvation-inducible DNA-binding protein